jgi:TonB family protein
LQGVVIAQVRVSTNGSVEKVKIVRTPNPALSDAAVRSVRNWSFRAARNAQGESVPVIVDVAVTFRLDLVSREGGSVSVAKVTGRKF